MFKTLVNKNNNIFEVLTSKLQIKIKDKYIIILMHDLLINSKIILYYIVKLIFI